LLTAVAAAAPDKIKELNIINPRIRNSFKLIFPCFKFSPRNMKLTNINNISVLKIVAIAFK
jgi:hypothetical protein